MFWNNNNSLKYDKQKFLFVIYLLNVKSPRFSVWIVYSIIYTFFSVSVLSFHPKMYYLLCKIKFSHVCVCYRIVCVLERYVKQNNIKKHYDKADKHLTSEFLYQYFNLNSVCTLLSQFLHRNVIHRGVVRMG